MKLQRLQKVQIWAFGLLVQQFNSLQEVLKLKQNFQKNKAVTGKTLFFVIGSFYSSFYILFVSALASDMAVLYGNYAVSILVLSTEKF